MAKYACSRFWSESRPSKLQECTSGMCILQHLVDNLSLIMITIIVV